MQLQLGLLAHVPLILAIFLRLVTCQSNGRFVVPSEGQIVPNGKVFSIQWEGFPRPPSSIQTTSLHLFLVTGSNPSYVVLIWYDIVYSSDGSFDWIPPTTVPYSNDYQTYISASWDPDNTRLYSRNFTISKVAADQVSSSSSSTSTTTTTTTTTTSPSSSSSPESMVPPIPTTTNNPPKPSETTQPSSNLSPATIIGGAVGGSVGAIIIILTLAYAARRWGWFSSQPHIFELSSGNPHARRGAELEAGKQQGENPSELPAVEVAAVEAP